MVKVIKEKFVVIGKEGSTLDGEGFIQKLWDDANSHFSEVAHLAKKDANGGIVGIWGAMSDISRSFKPWEDGFSKGLYLAGVLDKNCNIYKQGKNWYCEVENIKITINSYSYTIITAHIVK